MHQDTKLDIRECERRPSGRGAIRDLTQNWSFAEKAIGIADRFFRFDFSEVYFSGYVTDDRNEGGYMCVEVWHDQSNLYSIKFFDAGMEGTLIVGLKDPEKAFTQDILGSIRKTVNETRGFRFDPERLSSIEVDDFDLTLTIDLRP